MTKENALNLIRMTVFEFHRDVMMPLNENIHLYDRTTHSNVVSLREKFYGFSSSVRKLYLEVTRAIRVELDNLQTSKLLSLCRDISELYNLQIFKDMPESIPDNSPIRYIEPDMSYAQGFDNVNVWFRHQLNEFRSRLNETASLFEEIVKGVNGIGTDDRGRIIPQIEGAVRSAAETFEFLKALLPLFDNEHIRTRIDEFLVTVANTDTFYARAEIAGDVAHHQYIEFAYYMTRSIRELSRGVGTITEDSSGRQNIFRIFFHWFGVAGHWLSIAGQWLKRIGFNADISGISWGWDSGDTAIEVKFEIPSFLLGLTLKRYVLDNSELSLFFAYNIHDERYQGGASVTYRASDIRWLSQFTLESNVEQISNGFKVTFNLNTVLYLDRYSNLDIRGSVTPSYNSENSDCNNSETSVGVTYNRRGGGAFALGAEASFNNANNTNSITADFFVSLRLNERFNMNTNYRVPILGNGTPSMSLLFKARLP
ncbi:MAG: hypothetical protein LBI28_06135 [Treponema sp.]|jgi:hypothetical protein|nr:hypothetical protein [Treponema sp.]